MHLLIKYFANKTYLEEFVSGSLYMNSLDYFWNNGFDEQHDCFEGVDCTIPVESMKTFSPGWRSLQVCDFIFRAEGYRYCNVLCFEKINCNINKGCVNARISGSMVKFGEYIAFVNDETEFIRRIEKAVKEKGYKYLCGDVHYHKPKKNGKIIAGNAQIIFKADEKLFDIDTLRENYNVTKRDCFDKSIQYRTQREWRVALFRGVKDIEAYRLEIGDLSDIITVCKYGDFYNTAQRVINNNGLNKSDCYYGNISRKELKKRFCDLGDNKASFFMVLGESIPIG